MLLQADELILENGNSRVTAKATSKSLIRRLLLH